MLFSIPYDAYVDLFYVLLRTFSSGSLRFCQQKPFSSFFLEWWQNHPPLVAKYRLPVKVGSKSMVAKSMVARSTYTIRGNL